MDDVADLVLTPFRDIVEKGKQAVENAGDAQPMLKASQNLVKEGERALRRIEPLCRKHLEEYGSNFLDALKENDDIANFRSELTDLLWEFDDFIEVDDFEADKFAELQALSRKAAPKIYDILMRMKLEVPPDNDARSIVMMRMSRPSSPPPMPLPPLPMNPPDSVQSPVIQSPVMQSPVIQSPVMQSPVIQSPIVPSPVAQQLPAAPALPERKSSKSPPSVEEATAQLRRMMQSRSGPVEGFELPPLPGPPPKELPPRPPSANPWDVKTPPVAKDRKVRDDFRRRAPVASPELPPVEAVSPVSPEPQTRHNSTGRPRPLKTAFDRSSQQSSHHSDEQSLSPGGLETASYERSYSVFPGASPRSRTPNPNSFMSTSIPEDFTLSSNRGSGAKYGQPVPRYSQTNTLPPQLSRPESLESDPSSVFDHRRPDRDSTSAASEHRSSDVSAAPTSPTLGTSELSPTSPHPYLSHNSGLDPVRKPIPEVDYGPIPVESERQAHNPNLVLSTVDTNINANSSFYIHKGFCEGAQEVIRGEAGIRKTKRPGFAGATTVAKCVHCFYELDFKEVELDVYKDARGNFIKHGIGFRIRFLQKCHVATRRVDDVLYGCVFCIHQGRTLNASDATVFISQKALFQHLARHPRPLPEIPGITVVDGPEVPPELKNDYDIHFKSPPEIHPLVEKADEVALLPTATTKEAARRMYGQKLLFDRTPALEMVQGSKVTGITWPDKYLGDWAFGWHDGIYASVPTEILRLDQPADKYIKMSGSSQIRAVARWKFNPKDKDKYKGDWLKFNQGEAITNIGFPYREFWCWTGTNSKGKWGLFPRAFIDETTVEDMTAGISSDRASVLSSEKNRSMSMLSRLSTRKSARNGRPPSIAGSTGSHETPPPYPSFMRS